MHFVQLPLWNSICNNQDLYYRFPNQLQNPNPNQDYYSGQNFKIEKCIFFVEN